MKAQIGTYPKDRQLLYEKVPFDTPLVVDFFVANICNFRCGYCLQSSPEEVIQKSGLCRRLMDMTIFRKGLDELKKFPRRIKTIALVGIGEPTLNPHLPEMIREVRERDVSDTVLVITNGSRLTPQYGQKLVDAGLQILRISLQGLSAEKYWEISKAKIDFDEFYENIVHFSKIKGDCKLKVKIADTAMSPRGGDEQKFFALFGDIADAVAVEHIYEAHTSYGKMYDIAFVKTDKNRYGHPVREVKICRMPFMHLTLTPDGLIAPCCNAIMGYEESIQRRSMYEAWTSPTGWINGMRLDFLRHDTSRYAPCQGCSFPMQNSHPEDILDGHEEEILSRMER